MVPRVVAVTKNHITKFDLEKEERIRDKKMQKGGLTNYALSSYPHNIEEKCSLASARIKMYDHGVLMCSNYHRPVLV